MDTQSIQSSDSPIVAEIYPLMVKISPVDGVKGILDLMTFTLKNTGPDIYLKNIQIDLPVGPGATEFVLENTEGSIRFEPGQKDIWSFNRESGAFFAATPKDTVADKVLFTDKASFSFTLQDITLNYKEGVAPIKITLVPEAGPDIEYNINVTKTLNTEAALIFTVDHANINPGESCRLSWEGKFIDTYDLSSSTDSDVFHFTAPSSLERKPAKLTHYTMDARNKDTHLQIQRTVHVFNPLLEDFKVSATAVDKEGWVELTWATRFADGVKLECTDKSITLKDKYDITAPFMDPKPEPHKVEVFIGPITKPITITAWAVKGPIESSREHRHVVINPPFIEAFNITALPLEPNKKCSFKLDWKMKNYSSFEIIEQNGHTQDARLPIPAGATQFTVEPAYEQTTYKLNVFEIAKPIKGETNEN